MQQTSSVKRPGFRPLCFLCLAQQVPGKKFVVALAETSSVQSYFEKTSTRFSMLVGCNHTNRSPTLLDGASLYPSLAAPKTAYRPNSYQGSQKTALAVSFFYEVG